MVDKWDKNKVYGWSEEWIIAHGEPIENRRSKEGNPNLILTKDEIHRMFPAQYLLLTNVNGRYNGDPNFESAAVLKYQCSSKEYHDALQTTFDEDSNVMAYNTVRGLAIGMGITLKGLIE